MFMTFFNLIKKLKMTIFCTLLWLDPYLSKNSDLGSAALVRSLRYYLYYAGKINVGFGPDPLIPPYRYKRIRIHIAGI